MPDHGDHDAAILVITMRGMRNCGACAFLETCGGQANPTLWGCFARCASGCGDDCDYTCPARPLDFFSHWEEVGGFSPQLQETLPDVSAPLPRYLPVVQHVSNLGEYIPRDMFAIKTSSLLGPRANKNPLQVSLEAQRFKQVISDTTRVVLLSSDVDPFVEGCWRSPSDAQLQYAVLRNELDPVAVTTPNFSFFVDAPRTHSLRNRWRIVRLAEELARGGLPPVLHLNADNDGDWDFWTEVLRHSPSSRVVCKEFQTGLKNVARGRKAIDDLARMQDVLERDIHPILAGGGCFAPDAERRFTNYTIADSRPFMETMNRRRLCEFSGRWESAPTDPGEPLDQLLEYNMRMYETRLFQRISSP